MGKYPFNISEIRALRSLEKQERAYEMVEAFYQKSGYVLRSSKDPLNKEFIKRFPNLSCYNKFKSKYLSFANDYNKRNSGYFYGTVFRPLYEGFITNVLLDIPTDCLPSVKGRNKKIPLTTEMIDLAEKEVNRRTFGVSERKRVLSEYFPEEESDEFKLNPRIRLDFIHAHQKFENEYLSSFRGMEVFYRASEFFFSDSKWKRMIKNGELTVLVPAGGNHLAPLQIAFGLIDQNSIRQAEFIYTEANPIYLHRIDSELATLRDLQVIQDYNDHSVIVHDCQKKADCSGEGTETEFNFTYRGKKVKIKFALNRSGGDYWRTEYLQKADLVVFHDLDIRQSDGVRLTEKLLRDKDPKRALFILSDSIVPLNEEYYLRNFRGKYGCENAIIKRDTDFFGYSNQFYIELLSTAESANLFFIPSIKK